MRTGRSPPPDGFLERGPCAWFALIAGFERFTVNRAAVLMRWGNVESLGYLGRADEIP